MRGIVADGEVSFSCVAARLKVRGRCKLQDLRDHLDKAMFTPEIYTWRLFDILLEKKKGTFLLIENLVVCLSLCYSGDSK